jgi:hypothetical protein
MPRKYTPEQHAFMLNRIERDVAGVKIAKDFLEAFPSERGLRTPAALRKHVVKLKHSDSPEKLGTMLKYSEADRQVFATALNRAKQLRVKDLKQIFELIPAQNRRSPSVTMARLKGFRYGKAPVKKPVSKGPWKIPKMTRRGLNSYNANNRNDPPTILAVAPHLKGPQPGFYVINYRPYDLVKLGMAANLRSRLDSYVPTSRGLARVVHLRRFKNAKVHNPTEPFQLPLRRYEAHIKYLVHKNGANPVHGAEWYRRKNLPKIMRAISKNKNARVSKLGRVVENATGNAAFRNWNFEHGNSEKY